MSLIIFDQLRLFAAKLLVLAWIVRGLIRYEAEMMLDSIPLEHALDRGLARLAAVPADEEVRDACIQRLEFTFELTWKMLKRRLQLDLPNAQEVDGMTWRTLMRAGAEQGLIDDVDAWLRYREKRNITAHTYDAAKATEVAAVLPAFARAARDLLERLQMRGAADA